MDVCVAPSPSGQSGRSWCYVEAQVIGVAALASILHLCCMKLLEATSAESAWNFCAPVVDYNGLRKEVAAAFADKVGEVQGLVAKLQKTQRAAEQALDKCAPPALGHSAQPMFCFTLAGMRRLVRSSVRHVLKC